MFRLKLNLRKRSNLFILIAIVALIVATFAILANKIAERFDTDKGLNHNLSLFFLILSIILLINVLILSALFFSNLSKKRSYLVEMLNFKDFLHSLHNVSSETEIYEVLINLLSNIPSIKNVNVFYNHNSDEGSSVWNSVSKSNSSECCFSSNKCPLLCENIDTIVENVGKCIKCTSHPLNYKKGSFICFTIVDNNNFQDILHIYSEINDFFDQITVSRIKSYIEVVRLVINSKRTQYTLNKTASTDKLTKLYNRNYLDHFLDNQIEVANLSGQYLSIIMVDLDHYKVINDTYGHFVGDFVLTIFADIVLSCIRKTDIVARYGGDEFLVVLPATDTETAELIAERIRTTLSNTVIPPLEGIAIPPVHCSLGVSTYPIHCSTKGNLIKTSDIALYSAKNSGRNCTRVYASDLVS